MRITKLLTLTALAAIAGACGGMSPTSPMVSAPSDDATAIVSTMAVEDLIPNRGCKDVRGVRLLVLPDVGMSIKVKAVYLTLGGNAPGVCSEPPVWTARPNGRLMPTKDPFIVQVTRTVPPTNVQVVAKAPNGVAGSIVVK